jgi:hypothetical protein
MIRTTTETEIGFDAECQGALNRCSLVEIATLIRLRTFDRVRNLTVTSCDGVVRLSGQAGSFYVKQLAQHAALEAIGGVSLYNAIEVDGAKR